MSTINLPMYVQNGKLPHGVYAGDDAAHYIQADTKTNQVVYTSPATLGLSTFDLCLSGDSSLLFGCGTGGKVVRVNLRDRSFIEIAPGGSLEAICCNALGTLVYVANTTSGDVAKYDGTTLALIDTAVALTSAPRSICLSKDESTLYVGDGFTAIERIQTSDMSGLSAIIGGAQFGVCRDHAGTRLYGSSTGGNAVKVVDTTQEPPVIIASVALGASASPRGICISADDSTVYVACNLSNKVSVIDTGSNAEIHTISMASPDNVALSPDGKYLYVTDGSDTLQVISTLSNTIVGTIPGGVGNLAGLAAVPV